MNHSCRGDADEIIVIESMCLGFSDDALYLNQYG